MPGPAPTRRAARAPWSLVAVVLVALAAMQGWQQLSQSRLDELLAQRAKPDDIRMIASVDCVYCAQATRWFNANRVPFASCEIERDASCAAAYAALGSPGTPVMVVRGKRLVGFSRQAIVDALAAAAPAKR